LILVQGNRHESSFSFLQADNHFSQQYLLKRLSVLHHVFLVPLSKIRWPLLCGIYIQVLYSVPVSSYLFLCQYHTVLIAKAL
jgi:hypothetical protein